VRYVKYSPLSDNCGAVRAYNFAGWRYDSTHRPLNKLKEYCLKTNRRMIIATYNNLDNSQIQAAQEMAEMFTVIGTSDLMHNPNSGNEIFSVTYKVEK